MQPYQLAGKEIQRQKDAPMRHLKRGVAIGASVLAGGAVLSRILPLLSPLIPESIAVKGLTKVEPRLGKFINGAVAAGHTVGQALRLIKEKLQPEESQEENPNENRNIIEQYSPELSQFLTSEIQQGRTPIQAGAIAQSQGKFNAAISKMTKDHKVPWSAILETVFGGQGQVQPQQRVQEQQQQEQPQGGQQNGPGAQALMAILQKIQQSRGQQ